MIRAKGVRGNGKVKILFPKTGVVSDFLREVSLSIVSGLDDPPTHRVRAGCEEPELWQVRLRVKTYLTVQCGIFIQEWHNSTLF